MNYVTDSRIFDVSVTWRDWQFGPGFFVGNIFVNALTQRLHRIPPSVTLYLGPFSFSVNFGRTMVFGVADTFKCDLGIHHLKCTHNVALLRLFGAINIVSLCAHIWYKEYGVTLSFDLAAIYYCWWAIKRQKRAMACFEAQYEEVKHLSDIEADYEFIDEDPDGPDGAG